jgi:hypothetical protein
LWWIVYFFQGRAIIDQLDGVFHNLQGLFVEETKEINNKNNFALKNRNII